MMTQAIERCLREQPFQPFRVLVADGRRYDVTHPERLAVAGKGRLISIGMDDHFVTLDLLLVSGIEKPIPGKKSRGNGKA